MSSFRVDMTVARTITFYLEAESEEEIEDFLDSHPDWKPGDIEGLIDFVGDEVDTGFTVTQDDEIEAAFFITPDGKLEEIAP